MQNALSAWGIVVCFLSNDDIPGPPFPKTGIDTVNSGDRTLGKSRIFQIFSLAPHGAAGVAAAVGWPGAPTCDFGGTWCGNTLSAWEIIAYFLLNDSVFPPPLKKRRRHG